MSIMKPEKNPSANWGAEFVSAIIHPLTIVMTPICLLLITSYFVVVSFQTNIYSGIRSLSAALFPLIIITFIHIFKRSLLSSLGKPNIWLSFISSVVWGFILMLMLRLSGDLFPSYFPLSEIILSGSFAVLVFSYAEDVENNKVLSYYYGLITGFLLYIVIVGFPPNVFATGFPSGVFTK